MEKLPFELVEYYVDFNSLEKSSLSFRRIDVAQDPTIR